jgi:hypothetical protein
MTRVNCTRCGADVTLKECRCMKKDREEELKEAREEVAKKIMALGNDEIKRIKETIPMLTYEDTGIQRMDAVATFLNRIDEKFLTGKEKL